MRNLKRRLTIQLKMMMSAILLIGLFYPLSGTSAVAAASSTGFVIHADRIVGKMMVPSLVIGETSEANHQPMLRFHYSSVTIYGLTLTKVIQSPNGPITVKIESPKATATNMKVDVTAFSAGGACLKLGETFPAPVLKDVTLVAHKQTASTFDLSNARISSVEGNHDAARPSTPNLLKDLQGLTLGSLKEAISDLMNARVPLSCDNKQKDKANGSKEKENVVDKIIDKDGGDLTNTAEETVNEVTEDVGDTIGNVVGDVDETVNKTVANVEDTVNDITNQTSQMLDQLLMDANHLLHDTTNLAGGIINKRNQLNRISGNISNRVINPVRELLQAPVEESELEAIKSDLTTLIDDTKKIKNMEQDINHDQLKLKDLQTKLADVKKRLKSLKKQEGADAKVDDVQNQIANVQRKIDQTKKDLAQMDGKVNKTQKDIGNLVDDVRQTVDDIENGSGGLLGGLFNGVFNIIQGLLGDITVQLKDIDDLLTP